MSKNEGTKPFMTVSGGFASQALKLPRTGNEEADRALAILHEEGYELRDMTMPFPLVIMSFNHKAAQLNAVLIYKDGDQPFKTPTGMVITESLIAFDHEADENKEPKMIPVRKFIAERQAERQMPRP